MKPTQAHPFARTDTSRLARWWWTTDHWLLGPAVALIALGVLLQFGTSPAAATRIGHLAPFHFAFNQCLFAVAGFAMMVGASLMSPRGVRRIAFVIYVLALLAMIALPFLGHNHKGAARWVEFAGFALQPSEFMKPALLVLAAWMFAEAQKGEIPGVSIAFGLYLLPVGLLLIEPDIGQTILITAAFCAAFWVAGVPIGWIMGMGAAASAGLALTPFVFPHVAARLNVFVNHKSSEPTQVQRAAEAITAGGAFGRGPGEGVRKVQIPDMHTDFAYSAAAEEYGLWLSLVLITLFATLVLRGLYRAMRMSDPFEQVAAAGLFCIVGMQAFINVVVNLGLAPTKGMTLPFISYGGSSMLATCLTVGMALALTRRRQTAYGAQADDHESDFVG
jgi:cell division protein FtsW